MALQSTILVGCGSGAMKGDQIKDSPDYVSHRVLQDMQASRMLREDVIARLGQPFAENSKSRGIGYLHCVNALAREWVVFFFIPVPGPSTATAPVISCECVGVWFDADSLVSETASSIASYSSLDPGMNDERRRQFEFWLGKPGGNWRAPGRCGEAAGLP